MGSESNNSFLKQRPATAKKKYIAWCSYLKATMDYLTGIDDNTSLIVLMSDTLVCKCGVGVGILVGFEPLVPHY